MYVVQATRTCTYVLYMITTRDIHVVPTDVVF